MPAFQNSCHNIVTLFKFFKYKKRMERNVNCHSFPGAKPKWLVSCASSTAENKKIKKNQYAALTFTKSSDKKPETFLLNLI